MAELLTLGLQRIFYRSTNFNDTTVVVADILDPDLHYFVGQELQKAPGGRGLFYWDYNFKKEGTYIVSFYESGKLKATQGYSVRNNKFFNGGGYKGPSVIHT